jgi:hypothetical protein
LVRAQPAARQLALERRRGALGRGVAAGERERERVRPGEARQRAGLAGLGLRLCQRGVAQRRSAREQRAIARIELRRDRRDQREREPARAGVVDPLDPLEPFAHRSEQRSGRAAPGGLDREQRGGGRRRAQIGLHDVLRYEAFAEQRRGQADQVQRLVAGLQQGATELLPLALGQREHDLERAVGSEIAADAGLGGGARGDPARDQRVGDLQRLSWVRGDRLAPEAVHRVLVAEQRQHADLARELVAGARTARQRAPAFGGGRAQIHVGEQVRRRIRLHAGEHGAHGTLRARACPELDPRPRAQAVLGQRPQHGAHGFGARGVERGTQPAKALRQQLERRQLARELWHRRGAAERVDAPPDRQRPHDGQRAT